MVPFLAAGAVPQNDENQMGSLYSGWNSERFETAENQFHPTSMIFFGPLSTLENFGTPILTIVIIWFNDLYSHIIPTNNPHMDRYILIIVGEFSHDVAIYTAIIKDDNPKSPHLSSMIR